MGTSIAAELEGMPFIPVHCDYHPGNQKWVDERVVGLFDFDWSKLDYRIFDIALALVYFCSSWEGRDSGDLWLDKSAIFVRAYQDEAAKRRHARPHVGRRARRPAAHDRQRQPVRAQLGRHRLLRGRGRAKNDDEYLMYLEHQVHAHGVHRGSSRRAVRCGRRARQGAGHDQERV